MDYCSSLVLFTPFHTEMGVSEQSHALVPVTAFLREVHLRLVAHEELMAAIAETDALRIQLETVAEGNTVEVASQQHRH